MNRNHINDLKKKFRNLDILFVGRPHGAGRLKKAAASLGWTFNVMSAHAPGSIQGISNTPDLLILDDFPESATARSAFHHMRSNGSVPILALNSTPHAYRFMHVNALSFIKMIHRNPEPEELLTAVCRLLKKN